MSQSESSQDDKPRFSVTFSDIANNASLTINYDSEFECRRGVAAISRAIAQFGLARVVAIGQEFVESLKG